MAEGGHLIRLDWDRKRVVAEVPINPQNPSVYINDPSPRGGGRGCRGIVVEEDRVIALGYDTVHEFDRSLDQRRDISHGLMVGLHETTLVAPDQLWVTATSIDRALQYDLRTGALTSEFSPRDQPDLQAAFDLEPLAIDTSDGNWVRRAIGSNREDPSHLHMNAVAVTGDRVLALFNRSGAIVDLTEQRVIIRDEALKGGHNLVVLADGTLVSSDTHGRTVRFFDGHTGELVHIVDLMSFPWARQKRRAARQSDSRVARVLFVRGLAFADRHVYVGVSPASILRIDWHASTLDDVYEHSDDVAHAIHGLAIATDA